MSGTALTAAWAGIIAFAVLAYVVMDGFDLGIGLLFSRFPSGAQRDTTMNSIAPVWDGNETWLILGGGGLMAAFPLAYAIVLPAVYAPVMAMLLGLVLRGVAFEFRWRDPSHRPRWDIAFSVGSALAAMAQGLTLGTMLQGIRIDQRHYAGGHWDWLTPFTLLTGVSVCVGYALLGACWLVWKTDGLVQERARQLVRRLAPAMLGTIALVSLCTPFLDNRYYQRWFAWPRILFVAQVPLLVVIVAAWLWRSLRHGRDLAPFLAALALFALSFAGLAISMWPDVIPGRLSIWDAASPAASQRFMLAGTALLLPLILAYTAWSYWVFRGKVGGSGYH